MIHMAHELNSNISLNKFSVCCFVLSCDDGRGCLTCSKNDQEEDEAIFTCPGLALKAPLT